MYSSPPASSLLRLLTGSPGPARARAPGGYRAPPALGQPIGPQKSGRVGYHARPDAWPVRLDAYRGIEHSVENMVRLVQSPRGAFSPKVRFLSEWICKLVTPKDYLSEVLAIRHFVNARVPYFKDPVNVEWMRDPEAMVDEITLSPEGILRADCDEVNMLICSLWLASGHQAEFVTVGFQKPPAPKSHVFARCAIPKSQPPQWIVCDPVAGTREAFMLPRIVQMDTVPLG